MTFLPRWVTLLALASAALFSAAAADFENLSRRANEARDANRLQEAEQLYREALAIKPEWWEGWWYLGTLLYDQDRYTDAAPAFAKAAALNPKSGSAFVMLGLCDYQLGRYDDALAHIRDGRRLGVPSDPQFQRVMNFHEGLALLEKSQFDPAAQVLFRLVQDGVESDDLTRALGMAAMRVRPSELRHDAERNIVIPAVGAAERLVAVKKFDQAVAAYQQLVNAHPRVAGLHYAYGICLLAAHMDERAVPVFQQEVEIAPDHVLARLRIASLKYRTDPASALPYVEQAVKLDNRIPLGHYLSGLILLDLNRAREAVPHLEMARKAEPKEAQILFALGRAYAAVGRKQDAANARAEFQRLKAGK